MLNYIEENETRMKYASLSFDVCKYIDISALSVTIEMNIFMSEQNLAFNEVDEGAFGIDTGQLAGATNEQLAVNVLPDEEAQRSESLPLKEPNKIIDPFDEMLQTPEAEEVSFKSYKELYEFAVSNGFSPEALAHIKEKAEAEELALN